MREDCPKWICCKIYLQDAKLDCMKFFPTTVMDDPPDHGPNLSMMLESSGSEEYRNNVCLKRRKKVTNSRIF